MSEALIDLPRLPSWRQAVLDFIGTFSYGDLVSHAWLAERFGMPTMEDSRRMTASDFQSRQFEWLANVDAFRAELLRDHHVCLQSIRGEGYRWVPPGEQTGVAAKEFARDAKRIFRTARQKLTHVRVDELSDEQRRENLDAVAKVSGLRGMTMKALGR